MNGELKEQLDFAITNFIKNSWQGITIDSVNEFIKDAEHNLNILSFHDDFSAYYAFHKFVYLIISFNNVPYVLRFKDEDAVKYLSSKCCLLSAYDITDTIDFYHAAFNYDEPVIRQDCGDYSLVTTMFESTDDYCVDVINVNNRKALYRVVICCRFNKVTVFQPAIETFGLNNKNNDRISISDLPKNIREHVIAYTVAQALNS
jgi:hypothetical protein